MLLHLLPHVTNDFDVSLKPGPPVRNTLERVLFSVSHFAQPADDFRLEKLWLHSSSWGRWHREGEQIPTLTNQLRRTSLPNQEFPIRAGARGTRPGCSHGGNIDKAYSQGGQTQSEISSHTNLHHTNVCHNAQLKHWRGTLPHTLLSTWSQVLSHLICDTPTAEAPSGSHQPFLV